VLLSALDFRLDTTFIASSSAMAGGTGQKFTIAVVIVAGVASIVATILSVV
jgi:hypothetical protein